MIEATPLSEMKIMLNKSTIDSLRKGSKVWMHGYNINTSKTRRKFWEAHEASWRKTVVKKDWCEQKGIRLIQEV